jgi:hypothetical protein
MLEIPTIIIPAGHIIISWVNLKLLTGSSFIIGYLLRAAIDYYKSRGESQ